MKLHIKNISISLVICLLWINADGQKATLDTAVLTKDFIFDGNHYVDITKASPQQMATINKRVAAQTLAKDHYYFEYPWKTIGVRFTAGQSGNNSVVYEGLHWGGVTGKRHKSIIIDGDGGVEFSTLDITEANAKNFRYHVVQNDNKELVSWTQPSIFKKTTDGKVSYAYLGKYDYVPGQVLKVEIYNINDYGKLDAAIIDWRKIQTPKVFPIIEYFSRKFSKVDGELIGKRLNDLKQTTEQYFDLKKGKASTRPMLIKDFIETTNVNDIKFRADDSVKNLKIYIENSRITSVNKVTLKTQNGEIIPIRQMDNLVEINRELWKTPGKYTVTFTPRLQKHGGRPVYLLDSLATTISFTVLPSDKKELPLKTVVALILTLMTSTAIMFTIFRNKHKRKLAQEAQNRQIATLQLQSVRSQLNPHFIFNALAGIQNLINKNAIEDANKYLSRFARLTRNVLDDGQKDLISIEKETELLDDYLQMEQTRFGFTFSIKVDEQIDQQIEIPSMLLQPFVENAVKHGISALNNKGQIDVSISQSHTDLVLKVQDNGGGFKDEQTSGKGIQLCRERIALFNDIHKNTLILLNINPANNGTQVVIELKNWM